MIRWLTGLIALLILLCAFEARTIRLMKRDMEALRRQTPVAQPTQVTLDRLTPQYRDEIQRTITWLDAYYASPEGLKYAGGLCAGGRVDAVGLSTWVFGTYVPLRLSGASEAMAREKVIQAIQSAVRGRPAA